LLGAREGSIVGSVGIVVVTVVGFLLGLTVLSADGRFEGFIDGSLVGIALG